MTRDREVSDEHLSAYIDEQLAAEDRDETCRRIAQDAALSKRVCELHKLRDLVRLAYDEIPLPRDRRVPVATRLDRSIYMASGLAAAVALLGGVLLGWLLHHAPDTQRGATALSQSEPTVAVTSPSQAATTPTGKARTALAHGQVKVLFHLNSGDPVRIKEALDEMENLLRHYHKEKESARIELVANGAGLRLLRTDASPYPERIERMRHDYDNLALIACQNFIRL